MDNMEMVGLFVFSGFVVLFLLEMAGGKLKSSPRPLRDFGFTLFGMVSNLLIAGAAIGAFAGWLVAQLFPNHAGGLSHVGFWIAFPIIFLTEELAHYWLHRAAHEWRWLWKIHRTHHSAQQLNAGVIYRFNFFWVFMLPQTWMGAFAAYFGLLEPYIAAIMITFIVNLTTHSSYRWDCWLRQRTPFFEKGWWLLERVITLPDTHHAHHAYGKTAHPNGNYAVTVFLFDVIFGTAKIPHSEQTRYGLPISERLHWAEELLWPLVKKPLLPKPVAQQSSAQEPAPR